jgi:hypothetical protein
MCDGRGLKGKDFQKEGGGSGDMRIGWELMERICVQWGMALVQE